MKKIIEEFIDFLKEQELIEKSDNVIEGDFISEEELRRMQEADTDYSHILGEE